MSDFNGPELVAGTILGTRHWDLASGILRAPSFMTAWGPGENRASHMDGWFDPNLWTNQNHRVAQEDCRCGFYAYYDATGSEYRRPWRVVGVIEGYGLVSVGPLGFRAAKAKIIALTAPRVNAKQESWPHAYDTLVHNYPDAKVYQDADEMFRHHPTPRPDFAPETALETLANTMGQITVSFAPSTSVSWNKVFISGGGAAITKVTTAANNLVVHVGEAQTQAQKFEAAIKKPEPQPGWVQVSPGVHRYIPRGSQR